MVDWLRGLLGRLWSAMGMGLKRMKRWGKRP